MSRTKAFFAVIQEHKDFIVHFGPVVWTSWKKS